MDRQNQNNKKPGKWIAPVIALLFVAPQLILPAGIFVGIFYLLKHAAKKNAGESQSEYGWPKFEQPKFENPKFEQPKFTQPDFGRAKPQFDDCPQSMFCFHKDKGEHHVSRGKEIDPWDRPDIDISKYQRRH